MESFIMQMAQDMKDIGKIIWNKALPFIQIKMEKLNWYFLKRTEWSDKIIQLQFNNQVKKLQLRKKYNPIFTLCVLK